MISKVSYNAYASNVNSMTKAKDINFCSANNLEGTLIEAGKLIGKSFEGATPNLAETEKKLNLIENYVITFLNENPNLKNSESALMLSQIVEQARIFLKNYK